MPAAVEKRLNSLRNEFLWDEKVHLVRWQMVTREKKGGLGVRNLRLQNKSMLFKWLCRFSREAEAIWVKIIEAIHGNKQGWNPPFKSVYTRGGVWKEIY